MASPHLCVAIPPLPPPLERTPSGGKKEKTGELQNCMRLRKSTRLRKFMKLKMLKSCQNHRNPSLRYISSKQSLSGGVSSVEMPAICAGSAGVQDCSCCESSSILAGAVQ